MARPDPSDLDRKKRAPEQEQEEEQELEQKVESAQEQQRDAAQDALGNQEVSALLGLGGGVKAGEAGVGTDTLMRPEHAEKDAVDYGGDDLPPDAPIEMEDLVRSWNPGTRRGQDAPKFVEQMPTGALDDEDPELLAALDAHPPAPRERGPGVRLSVEAVLRDPTPLVRQARRLSDGSPLHRAWLALLDPTARCLVDPHGRLPLVRARVIALAKLLVEDALRASPRPEDTLAFATSCLELSVRGPFVDRVNDDVRTRELKLPATVDLVKATLERLPAQPITGRSTSVEVIEQVRALLDDLAPQVPASSWLVALPTAEEHPPEDDPLGLDGLLASLTGGLPDPAQGVHDAALESAEKLAAGCARLRTDAAAWLLALADVLGPRTSPEALGRVASQVDLEVPKVLQLLVEIARAIRQRAVPPAGLRNGLKRAAKSLDLAFTHVAGWVAGALVGCAGTDPSVALPPLATSDPLSSALAERRPAEALPWLEARARDDLGRAAVVLLRAAAGEVDVPATAALADALRRARPALAAALDVVAVSAAARAGGGQDLAQELAERAFEAGDDLILAVASQVEIDLAEDRAAARWAAVWRVASFGAGAGRTLLLRHVWPEDEDDRALRAPPPLPLPAADAP